MERLFRRTVMHQQSFNDDRELTKIETSYLEDGDFVF